MIAWQERTENSAVPIPSDEHGRHALSPPPTGCTSATTSAWSPGRCDPSVNLYDWHLGIRGNRVEQLWPITARGAIY